MFRGLSVAGLLLAWLCAQGALTDAVQVFAWVRMFSGYVQTTTWRAALEQTLDPEKPCEICCAVRKAREAEPSSAAPPGRDSERLDLVLLTIDVPPEPTSALATFPVLNASPTLWRSPVPKPPPRLVRGC
jgi:hypothetical protein